MSELTFSGLTFFHDKYRSGQKVERGSFLNIEFQKTEDPKSPQRGLRHRLFKETFQNNFPVEESISRTNSNVFKTKLKHLIWSFTYPSDLHFFNFVTIALSQSTESYYNFVIVGQLFINWLLILIEMDEVAASAFYMDFSSKDVCFLIKTYIKDTR